MSLFRLSLSTLLARKTFAVFVVLLLVAPLVMPYITPYEMRPSLLEPSRAQTAWGLLWVIALGWLFFQGASLGDRWSSHGVLEYLRTLGSKPAAQLAQVWLSCALFFGLFLLVVMGICCLFAMPAHPEEAKMWIATNLQYAFLCSLVVGPLLLLSIALGTRFNAAAAYVITLGLAAYGLFGISYLNFFLSQSNNPMLDVLYIVSPHFHLAELTPRLYFKLGALSWSTFGQVTLYLGGLGAMIAGFSLLLFRSKK